MGLTTNNNSRIFNHTCIGASHITKGIVCQDASSSYSDDNCDIIIVSDGHGSPKYFRSHKGSAFAVEVALTQIKRFVKEFVPKPLTEFIQLGPLSGQSALDRALSEQENMVESVLRRLCTSIVSEWYVKIESDWIKNPPTEEEMAGVPDNVKYLFNKDSHIEKAYGATLIAFVKTSSYWFAIHLGDGKCVAYSKDGSWSEPIPWDKDCFLNITTSLSGEDPEMKFRFCMGNLSTCPEAVFIGSDGMDDSYPPIETLASFYGLIVRLAAKNGFEAVEANITDFLPKLSMRGSKDDMSVAYWIKTDSVCNLASAIATKTIEKKKAEIEDLKAKETDKSLQMQKLEKEQKALMSELEIYNNSLGVSVEVAQEDADEEINQDSETKSNVLDHFINVIRSKIKWARKTGENLLSKSKAMEPLIAKVAELEKAIKSLNIQLDTIRQQIDTLQTEINDLMASLTEFGNLKKGVN